MERLSQRSKQWAWHNKYKVVIRCPRCDARHYPTRIDNKHLQEDKQYEVKCGCGHRYWVVDGKTYLYIKENRRDE